MPLRAVPSRETVLVKHPEQGLTLHQCLVFALVVIIHLPDMKENDQRLLWKRLCALPPTLPKISFL